MVRLFFGTFSGVRVRYWGEKGTWFVSFENLPEPVKDAIAVLNIVDIRETVEGVGTRYTTQYVLTHMAETTFDGMDIFEDTPDE